jgi:thiol-disulfide isomerase/thioredoxin
LTAFVSAIAPKYMRSILPLLLFFSGLAACSAQQKAVAPDTRRLEFTIKGGEMDTIFLANYYGSKLYYNDTAVADAKGRVIFARSKGYKAGVYAVVVPGPKYFEILVNEPLVVMETDTANLSERLVVKKSAENQVFLDYVRFINVQRKEAEGVNKEREATEDPIKKSALRERLVGYEKAIKNYQLDLVAKNPGTFVALIVKMSMANEDHEVRRADGSLDSAGTYYYYRAHFWDNTDLTDERILRTPVFQNKFDEYVGKVVPQMPDTINVCADELIRRMDHGEELFKFAVHNITYKYETSDIMGMDAVFVHMAQTYYCPKNGVPGRATWLTGEKLDKLCERARKQAPIIIGAKAKNIILTDTTEQKWVNLYTLPQEYVLVVFWDPHCGHCKKTLPDLYTQYKEKLRPLDVEVYSVAKATDSTLFADWKAFIRENKLDWLNVGLTWHVYSDAKQNSSKYIPKLTTIESLNYADAWDVYSTPKIFLLDGERKIVGKQLTPDQMVDLIANLKLRKKKDLEKGK